MARLDPDRGDAKRGLLQRLRTEAPGVMLQFVAKRDKESAPLRVGEVDVEPE